jgi:hypothetical protein
MKISVLIISHNANSVVSESGRDNIRTYLICELNLDNEFNLLSPTAIFQEGRKEK